MKATIVIKLFEKYATCPECGEDIVDYAVEDNNFHMGCSCGWEINGNETVAKELIKEDNDE